MSTTKTYLLGAAAIVVIFVTLHMLDLVAPPRYAPNPPSIVTDTLPHRSAIWQKVVADNGYFQDTVVTPLRPGCNFAKGDTIRIPAEQHGELSFASKCGEQRAYAEAVLYDAKINEK